MAELEAIIAEAREAVAAGRAPNVEGLETRLAASARAGADAAEVARVRRALASIVAVHRAKTRLAREPAPPASATAKPAALKTTPTITGTLNVRRAEGDGYRLVWDRDPKVTEWEVRFSE